LKLKAAFLISALVFATASPVQAQGPRSVDARTFDVAGVKTGMDFDEALAAAAQHFKVSKKDIRIGYAALDPVNNVKRPMNFSFKQDGVELLVHFEPRVPVDKQRPLAVSQIRYEMPWTPANKSAMAEAVIAKYGRQSNYPNDLNLEWCLKASTNPGMGCSPDQTQAVLKYSGVSIQLNDPAWMHARIAYMDQTRSRKPSF